MTSFVTSIGVLAEVAEERLRQDEKWGEQNHPDGTGDDQQVGNRFWYREQCERAFGHGFGTWRHILDEEIAEAYAESDPKKLREELVQAAAVIVAWVQAIDRRPA